MTAERLPTKEEVEADASAALDPFAVVLQEFVDAILANDGREVYRLLPDAAAQRTASVAAWPAAMLYCLDMTREELTDVFRKGRLTDVGLAPDGRSMALTFGGEDVVPCRFGFFLEGGTIRVIASPDAGPVWKARVRAALGRRPPTPKRR